MTRLRALGRLAVLPLLAAPLVLLAAPASLPTPDSAFGFRPGTDYKLFNYEQSVGYFKRLEASSKFITLVEAGKSTQGRTFYFALISNPKNLARIDHYLEINRRLAHPAGLTDDRARELAREGKVFVHIDGGLHATEVAGAQMMPLLAYDLLSRPTDPEIAPVLDNVIFMLWPTINPDGQTMVADWYMSHVGPPDSGTPVPQLPYLYQEYVGHDNNRDAYMLNMVESRVMEHTWRQWEPDIVYVLHQAPPSPYRIWLPPFAEPIATHAPPIPSSEVNMIGMAIAQGLDQHGLSGATHMGTGYDAWYPGYIDYMPIFKNIPAFWTETAGASASPSRVGNVAADLQNPHTLYPNPFMGGEWHLKNAVEYDETAALSVLEYATKYKDELLYGRYQSGRDQIKKGRTAAPYAYVIPQNQRDRVAAVELLRRLAFSGVRVSQLTSPATFDGTQYPTGTWVIPTDQEFAALVREVLDVQKYPFVEGANGQLDQPYDAAGWTLPLQMGLNVLAVGMPLTDATRARMQLLGPAPDPKLRPGPYNLGLDADASPFDSAPGVGFDTNPSAAAIRPPPGWMTGTGLVLAVNPGENNAFRAINRALKAGLDVRFVGDSDPERARYVINGLSEGDQQQLVTSLAITAERISSSGQSARRPRLGLFSVPTSIDEGWTRWVLEQYGFEFARVAGAEVQAGSLRAKYDVILITDEPRGVLEGGGRGAAGGRGGQGGAGAPPSPNPADASRVKALDEFIRSGGTLVCFNRSTNFAIDQLHLPVKNTIAGISRQQFFTGGSLMRVTTNRAHQVMAGMPDKATIFFDGGPVFDTQEGFRGTVLASYQTEGSPLASGYLLGEKYLQGKAAALDVELGAGHVVLFGFRPQWRGQSFGTFRMIFNAAMYTR